MGLDFTVVGLSCQSTPHPVKTESLIIMDSAVSHCCASVSSVFVVFQTIGTSRAHLRLFAQMRCQAVGKRDHSDWLFGLMHENQCRKRRDESNDKVKRGHRVDSS